jgi:sugar fermentation stimulation protein A
LNFYPPLVPGTLIKRYKRFLADVELADGKVVTAHCANTGAMTGCAEPGSAVWLQLSSNIKRKLPYSWQISRTQQGHWIGINTLNANTLVAEGIATKAISELHGYDKVQREVKFGNDNSRIDFCLTAAHRPDCYVEVKSVTYLDNHHGYFPDAKTVRGQRHVRELGNIAQQGKRAVLLFLVQHSGIHAVHIAKHIDEVYNHALLQAMAVGVEVLAYTTKISPEKILINQSVPTIV